MNLCHDVLPRCLTTGSTVYGAAITGVSTLVGGNGVSNTLRLLGAF